MKTIFYSLLFLTIIIGQVAYSQSNRPDGDIVTKLRTYNKAHLAEKVYLQFDKPYYATGDTMYFKAYVTMGERHNLSAISGVLHAELIGIDNKANQSIKLQLVDGVGWGDFALPDSLAQGTYRVRAYTRWMRNSGDDSYFEKTIPIGSLHQNKIPESNTARIKPVLAKTDLQFFPESGGLVTGINTKIAFKAIGTNGMGMDIKGEITDNTGKEITGFASTHLGMGYFDLKPEEGKSYKANITYADGTKDVLPLPISNSKGISLIINNDSIASAGVKIEANQNYFSENKGKEYSVLIYSGGIATTVRCKLDSPTLTMDIIKRKLFTGITTITLFSQNNEPLAERLIFIQNYDQLNLGISTDKDTYATREKVSLKLNAKTRADLVAPGHFSVAITDENKVQVEENNETTILTNLLLTSDLKGTIEQPNYYFTNNDNLNNNEKQKELDLVMLTHGYRHFSWKQVLGGDSTNTTIAYQPETSLAVSGTAKNLLGTPLKKATVSLIAIAKNRFASQTTDDKGKFNFSGLNFNDSTKFVLQAVNAKGKNRTQLTYEPDIMPLIKKASVSQTNVNPTMATYLENDAKEQDELFKQGMVKVRTLKEVKIKAFKPDNNYRTSSLAGAGNADQVMHQDQLSQIQGPLVNSLNGRLAGVKFVPYTGRTTGSIMTGDLVPVLSGFSAAPMLVVVDGVDGASISNLDVSQVETVEVLRFSASIYGMKGGNGVLVVTTKQGGAASGGTSIGILPITVQGFYKAREFYLPKYTAAIPSGNHPDWRSTIYWAPEVVTDKDGNASLEFYNADGQGSYRVVVEGMDEKGNIGRKVYRYKVE
jgi:TonB-dependent Receptor Plug Domain